MCCGSITGRLLILVQINSWLTVFTIATACGLLSIPAFQKIAEGYLSASPALTATLLYFLVPPVFVFAGVGYSEPIFLLFSLLAWYFHREQKEFKASISAALCSLVRAQLESLGFGIIREHATFIAGFFWGTHRPIFPLARTLQRERVFKFLRRMELSKHSRLLSFIAPQYAIVARKSSDRFGHVAE